MTSNTSILSMKQQAILAEIARDERYTDWLRLGIPHKNFKAYYRNLELMYKGGYTKAYAEGALLSKGWKDFSIYGYDIIYKCIGDFPEKYKTGEELYQAIVKELETFYDK